MKTLAIAAVLALMPVASRQADPLEDMTVTTIDVDRLCQGGVCVMPDVVFLGLIQTNNELGMALQAEFASKTKRCAEVTPALPKIPKGKAT